MKYLRVGPDAKAIPLGEQPDLPAGRATRCTACGTRLRPGQPHTAMEPYPHAVYDMLVTRG
jgi:hypothetical protein